MCVRPALASTVITISLVGGAWTLDTNIPSPFTLTFYRVTTWKQFICHLLHSHSTGWQPGNHLHCHLLHSLTVTLCHLLHFHYLGCFCTLPWTLLWTRKKENTTRTKVGPHITTQLCSTMHSGRVKNVWDSLVSLSEQSGVGQGCRPKQWLVFSFMC